MAGIKISDLPAATTPLAGTEQFALVQSSSTKVATVANIGDVLSNSFVTKTLYASTSGVYTTVQSSSATWDSVYSTFQSNSASFAHENQDNNFQATNCFTNIQAGFSVTACGSYAGVIGGYYNDACGGGSAVAGGNNNDTYANFSFIGGGDDNSICGSGVESAIIGGNNNIIAANHCRSAIAGGTSVTSVSGSMLHAQSLYLKTLPTSDPGVVGVVWNDSGTLKIST